METQQLECEQMMMKTPSEDFIRAVAEFLETDATDILAEMGYVHPTVLEAELQPVAS